MLVQRHVEARVGAVADPPQRRLQIVLPDRRTVHVGRRDLVGRAARTAEVALGVRRPRPRVDGVAQLLVRELLARDVDRLEPPQLFLVRPLADVDHQRIREEALPLRIREVREEPHVVGKVARRELAQRNRPLLPVHHLERAVLPPRPVHHVEREAVHHRVDDRLALLVLVDELALVGRTDVQLPAVADDALVAPVLVVRDQVADDNLVKFDIHGSCPLLCEDASRFGFGFRNRVLRFGLVGNLDAAGAENWKGELPPVLIGSNSHPYVVVYEKILVGDRCPQRIR